MISDGLEAMKLANVAANATNSKQWNRVFSSEQKNGGVGKGGFGLTGIRERASLLGGVVEIQSEPGGIP